jgi:Zn-dependent protease with chaperone function
LKPIEIEGVIAHGMGYIGNRDARLMIIIVTGIAMFTFIAELAFRIAARGGGRRSKDSGHIKIVSLL